MENNEKNNNSTVDSMDIDLLSFETMECPPTPRFKVIDLSPIYDKPTTTPCRENEDAVDEGFLLFRGHDYTASSVDCGESGELGLGIAMF